MAIFDDIKNVFVKNKPQPKQGSDTFIEIDVGSNKGNKQGPKS